MNTGQLVKRERERERGEIKICKREKQQILKPALRVEHRTACLQDKHCTTELCEKKEREKEKERAEIKVCKREGEIMKLYPNRVNRFLAGRTAKEYYEDMNFF